MQKMYKPVRIGVVFTLVAALLTVYVAALYRMQIYQERPAAEEILPQSTVTRTEALAAARGSIYDRNGVVLASGRPTYNITVSRDVLLDLPTGEMNRIVGELVYAAMDKGVPYTDTLPVTQGAPFSYISSMTQEQKNRLDKYIEFFSLDPDITAQDLLAWMRGHYGIDFTLSVSEARLIIGVRYELEIRAIVTNLPPYVFAGDVSVDFVPFIEEAGLAGVFVERGFVREYHTSSAAHMLGYIGQIPNGQVEKYSELGYPMDAIVGLTGAELAFEELLRGVNGKQQVTLSDTGAVMEVETLEEAVPGQNIYLTLDVGLQEAAENALQSHIVSANMAIVDEPDEDDAETEDEIEDVRTESERITGGAIVVLDVNSGEVLAAASYPTFDRATLTRDYTRLERDPDMPMVNRATQGRYSPGSTFKMVTALAALRHGVISRNTEINDVGVYDEYETYKPSCWIYDASGVGHGRLSVVQALAQSCNYFFLYSADRILGGGVAGAEALAEVAREFGLGQSTGLEVYEERGVLATPETKEEVQGEEWYSADTLLVSFGHGINLFTPVQLANYAATIANGGKLHELTLLRRAVSADSSEVTVQHEPVVRSEIAEKDLIAILQEGMFEVAQSGTARTVFSQYQVGVAAKTGTIELESSEKNNAAFVCYAPADDPQIAISVVIEKGGSGSQIMDIARSVFDYYFGSEVTSFAVAYGDLIP